MERRGSDLESRIVEAINQTSFILALWMSSVHRGMGPSSNDVSRGYTEQGTG